MNSVESHVNVSFENLITLLDLLLNYELESNTTTMLLGAIDIF